MTCPSCHAALPAGARFCPACGAASPDGPTMADQRRVATVVIGDLAGFTTLSEELDPEEVKRLVDTLFARLATDVTDHGGTVDKVVGDAIVALFGAPIAHEDDPERAVRAALRMQRSVAEVSQQLGIPLAMRIGVNTGEVLVGGLAADDTYTAMGDAVNVASRLEHVAVPGTVLVGHDTHQATRETIRYRDGGRVPVRGRAADVHTWIAEDAIGTPGTHRGTTATSTVGRTAEASLLDAILGLAVERRRAHLVEVTGEAGIGKRQVAEAFAARARSAHGALVLQARVPPYGEASMWTPAVDMLRSALGEDAGELDEQVLSAIVAPLMGTVADAPSPAVLGQALAHLLDRTDEVEEDQEVAMNAAVDAVVAVVEAQASRRPIVAILSNTQWGDAAMLQLMTRVLHGLRRSPLVAVTTSRSDGAHLGVAPWEMVESVDSTRLRLAPLEEGAATELARVLLGPDADDEALAAAVRRSGGNPRVLEEIAALASAGPGTAVDTMPMTLRGLVSARLDTLPARARRLLEDAAMIGYTGPIGMLLDIATARGEQDAPSLLEGMVDQDLFAISDGSYRFTTDVLREAAYLQLPKADRVARHRDIGARLAEGARAGSGTALRRRAQHLAAAAELSASGGTAESQLISEALDALEQAAAWSAGRDPGVTLDLTARAAGIQPDLPPGLQLQRARALADLDRFDQALVVAEELLAADLPDPLRAAGLTVLGLITQAQGALVESEQVLGEAVETARRADDDQALAGALRTLSMTLVFRGSNDRAEAAAQEAAAVYDRLGDAAGQAWALQHRGWIALNRGDLAQARALGEEAMPRFEELGDRQGLTFTTGLVGWTRYMEGDLDGAEAMAHGAAVTEGVKATSALGNGMARILIAGINLWRGDAAAAQQGAAQAATALQAIGHAWAEMVARVVNGRALAHLGRADQARQEIDQAIVLAGSLDQVAPSGIVHLTAAAIEVLLGEPGRAEARLAVQGPVEDVARDPDVGRLLAQIRLQQQRPEDAVSLARGSSLGSASASGQVANAAVAAFVLACTKQAEDGEIAALRRAVEQGPATYADLVMARLATAISQWTADSDTGQATADGDRTAVSAETEVALSAARAAVVGTSDHPMAALVGLVASVLRGDAPDDVAAIAALRTSGITGTGWQRALAMLSAHVPR